MSDFMSRLWASTSTAGRQALILGGLAVGPVLLVISFDEIFHRALSFDLEYLLIFNTIFYGCGWFVVMFIYTFFRLRDTESINSILRQKEGLRLPLPLQGFVAMEYYALILNRTYLVFIAPDGLYGWKVEGAVDASNRNFFALYAHMLKDYELMTNPEAICKLSKLKGGFFLPQDKIVAVEPNYNPKWGMGGIPHSGRIRVRLASRRSREFILLGYKADPETIQKNIMQVAASA